MMVLVSQIFLCKYTTLQLTKVIIPKIRHTKKFVIKKELRFQISFFFVDFNFLVTKMRTDELFGMANGLRDMYDICFGSYILTNSTISVIANKCLAQPNQAYSHLFTGFLWRIWHFTESAHFFFQFKNKQKLVTSTSNKTISNRFGRCCNLGICISENDSCIISNLKKCVLKAQHNFSTQIVSTWPNITAYNALQILYRTLCYCIVWSSHCFSLAVVYYDSICWRYFTHALCTIYYSLNCFGLLAFFLRVAPLCAYKFLLLLLFLFFLIARDDVLFYVMQIRLFFL